MAVRIARARIEFARGIEGALDRGAEARDARAVSLVKACSVRTAPISSAA